MRPITTIILIILLGQTNQVLGQSASRASGPCVLLYDSALNKSYYSTAEKMPAFKGGRKELTKVINKNLKWPGGLCDVEGTVFVAFIVEANGQISNKRVLRGLNNSEGCNADNEALKVIDFLTSWTAGQCDGKNVAVQYVVPVKFKITAD
jgi:TonB family protein